MTRESSELKYETLLEERVLAVDPIQRGFGFAVVEASPLSLIDWGVRVCTRKNPAHCELSLGSLIARYEPTALVLEDPAGARTLRRASLQSFLDGVLDLVDGERLPLYSYSRAQVRTLFGAGGAWTRESIAVALTLRFPELRPRLPRPRHFFDSEDSRMSIFDALSFAVAHLAADRKARAEASTH